MTCHVSEPYKSICTDFTFVLEIRILILREKEVNLQVSPRVLKACIALIILFLRLSCTEDMNRLEILFSDTLVWSVPPPPPKIIGDHATYVRDAVRIFDVFPLQPFRPVLLVEIPWKLSYIIC